MAGLLDAIGRAKPVTGYLKDVGDIRARDAALEKEAVATNILQNKLDADEAETARRGRQVDVTLTPNFMGLPKDLQDETLEELRGQGIIDENNLGSMGGLEDYQQTVATTESLFKPKMERVVASHRQNAQAAIDNLNTLQSDPKTKPEALKQAQDNVNAMISKAQISAGKYKEGLATLQRSKADSDFAKIDPSKYTKESVGAFQTSGDYSDLVASERGGTGKTAQNYMLSDGTFVLSNDGGRTYRTAGGSAPIPHDSIKIPAGATLSEVHRKSTQEAVTSVNLPEDQQIDTKKVAIGGTGPWASLAAFTDAILGGVLGAETLFPETQANRQSLRLIKQTGKAALLNSARGAIWEQQKIDALFPDPDKFFTNPRTEALKFPLLRKTMLQEKASNNEFIQRSFDQKEIQKLVSANNEIDRLLSTIPETPEENNVGFTQEDDDLINKYLRKR